MSKLGKTEQALVDHDLKIGDADQENMELIEDLFEQREALMLAVLELDFRPPIVEAPINLPGSDKLGVSLAIYGGASDGTFDATVKLVDESKPRNTAVVKKIGRTGGSALKRKNQTWVWDAWVEVTDSSKIEFSINSDDYSFLLIDGKLLIDNGGLHGPETQKKTVTLEPGWHSIQLLYGQVGGGAALAYSSSLELQAFVPTESAT